MQRLLHSPHCFSNVFLLESCRIWEIYFLNAALTKVPFLGVSLGFVYHLHEGKLEIHFAILNRLF